MTSFPRLFAPIRLRNTEIRNRILLDWPPDLPRQGWAAGEDFVAYHEARAKGGAGLIVVEAARFHATGFTDSPELIVASDDCIPGSENLADSVHRHGAKIFGQISHSGRVTKRLSGGLRGVAYAPSVVPDQRFHTMPRAMSVALIEEIIAEAGKAARRFGEAGFDGIELLARSRAPDLGLPQSSQQPAHRRLWRQLREPAALPQQPPRRGPQRPG